MAHGIAPEMMISVRNQPPWRVVSVIQHPKRLDHVLACGESGQVADLHISDWVCRQVDHENQEASFITAPSPQEGDLSA